jgi:hypothetical protein
MPVLLVCSHIYRNVLDKEEIFQFCNFPDCIVQLYSITVDYVLRSVPNLQ